jgi:hypothetical protein
MSTLQQIETDAERLPASQKEELLIFLAMKLRSDRKAALPRKFSKEEIAGWIAEDEADMRRITSGQ